MSRHDHRHAHAPLGVLLFKLGVGIAGAILKKKIIDRIDAKQKAEDAKRNLPPDPPFSGGAVATAR